MAAWLLESNAAIRARLSNQLGGKARVEHWAVIVKKHVQHNVALRPCHEYPWTMMMMLMIVILYIVIYCDDGD